ncbi:MAG: hypothetical protein ABI634_16280 [Acidobacteriota bacterium]
MIRLRYSIGLWAVLMLTALVSAQTYPSHQISNGDLTATVYLPDATRGFYRTTRFDWSGAIASLKYKGHDFYGPWFSKITDIYDFGYEGPAKDVISADFTAMVGPAEEFGALGYNDVQPGGLFVKPGIGALRRDDGTYNHSRPYVIANGGSWAVQTGRNSVQFTHTLTEPSINFGYVYTKVLRLTPGKPQMIISHVMRNTGAKAIATNVYDHNFTMIDRQATGPGIEITVPWQMTRVAGRGGPGRAAGAPGPGAPASPGGAGAPAQAGAAASVPAPGATGPAGPGRQGPPVDPYAPLAPGERMGTQCGQAQMQTLASPQGTTLVYAKVLEGSECYQTSFSGFGPDAKDYDVRIVNKKQGAGVHITGDRPMTRFGYWSIRTVVAPEPYIDINIEPGQEFTWSYTYDYYTTK